MVMLDYLNAEIEKRQVEIAKITAERQNLDQRRHDLDIELRAYEDIRARLGQSGDVLKPNVTKRFIRSTTIAGTLTPKRSKLANHWLAVLRYAVERYPATVKNSEVGAIQRSAGYDASPSTNIRTHFHKLRQEGLYEYADRAAVRATQAAAELLSIPLGTNTAKQDMAVSDQTEIAEKETAGMPVLRRYVVK
jgi:hypothetical protein